MLNIVPKRAFRRNQYQRLKNKRITKQYWGYNKNKKQLGLSINTPKPCSYWMCRNPRKYLGEKTIHEKKSYLELKYLRWYV